MPQRHEVRRAEGKESKKKFPEQKPSRICVSILTSFCAGDKACVFRLDPSISWRLDAILKTAMATVKCASTQNSSRTLSEMISRYPPMSFRPVEYLIAPDSHFSVRQPLTHAPSTRFPETCFRSGHIPRVRFRGTYPGR